MSAELSADRPLALLNHNRPERATAPMRWDLGGAVPVTRVAVGACLPLQAPFRFRRPGRAPSTEILLYHIYQLQSVPSCKYRRVESLIFMYM